MDYSNFSKETVIRHDINLGVGLLEKRLPDMWSNVDANLALVTALEEEFQAHRDKFYTDNNIKALQDAAE